MRCAGPSGRTSTASHTTGPASTGSGPRAERSAWSDGHEVMHVSAPVNHCAIELFLLDEVRVKLVWRSRLQDTFGDNDEIYKSKVVPLESLVMSAS